MNDDTLDDKCLLNLQPGESFARSDDDNFVFKMHVPAHLFPLIVGKRSVMKQEIEETCSVSMKIPTFDELRKQSNQSEINFIHITGKDKKNILEGKKRIDYFVQTDRKKARVNYFISIPFGGLENVKERFENFKKIYHQVDKDKINKKALAKQFGVSRGTIYNWIKEITS